MSTSSRGTRFSVIERLIANPQDFSFVQAVRLLERCAVFSQKQAQSLDSEQKTVVANHPVARFSPPIKEAVRFTNDQSFNFPISDIRSIDENNRQWKVLVNFIGLTGSMGVMPFHYTEMILQRLKQKDASLNDFLALFNHRTTSLFYQASNKYRLSIEYERSKLHKTSKTKNCTHSTTLLSLLGLGTPGLSQRLTTPDESLIFYSGLISQQVKTPSGLQQIIQDYFDVPAHIQGFIGQWQELIDDVRTRLPRKIQPFGQNAQLGRSAMLGSKGWFAQGKVRIKLGPLNKQQFYKFAPGTGALRSLNEISRTYLGMERDYDFVIQVNRKDVPNKVALTKVNPPLMAWNTWLSGKPKTKTEKDELLEILVSSKKLR